MSAHAFVDETKAHGLVLVAAVLAPRDLAPARAVMRALCLPGQARVHFAKERPARRRQIVDALAATGTRVDIYDATALTRPRQARAACLERVVADLAAVGAHRLVIEADESLLRADQAVLYAAVRRAGAGDTLVYEHLPARSEPLLWIADAAAWCWARGPAWQQRLAPVLGRVHRL